ncbi:MAG: zf-HC2 domain-containing protein [Treponema sp.]|jgi:hypothetical protein|nr:zf-HC2 domain-containing protein [Treponema sp.]
MCPDRQILSVYFDNELCSPWKEKLEAHLEECPACRAILRTYGRTREGFIPKSSDFGMRLEGSEEQAQSFGIEAAQARVWERLSPLADNWAGRVKPRPGRNIWSRSIRVPVPAAAAGLILAAAIALLTVLRPAAPPAEPQLAGMGMDLEDMAPIPDMASLLQYLGSDTSADMVIIKLPETTFRTTGEPKILRAADYSKGGGIP